MIHSRGGSYIFPYCSTCSKTRLLRCGGDMDPVPRFIFERHVALSIRIGRITKKYPGMWFGSGNCNFVWSMKSTCFCISCFVMGGSCSLRMAKCFPDMPSRRTPCMMRAVSANERTSPLVNRSVRKTLSSRFIHIVVKALKECLIHNRFFRSRRKRTRGL